MKEKKKNQCANEKNLEYKIEIATQTLDRNVGFITNCDNKTSIVLAIIGVLLTIILTNNGLSEMYSIIKKCIEMKTFCSIFYLILFIIPTLAMLVGMYNLCGVLLAKTNEVANGLDEKNSHVFFSGIGKHGEYQVYKQQFVEMNKLELLDELLIQIYINADIANNKYKKYNMGLKLISLGFSI